MKSTERFEILETIQDGMVATSYKARDLVLDRTVLLKVLHPRKVSDQDMVQRFRREAMLQARLKHPNIVTVYDFGTEEDMYIASEFVEGTTLEAMLEKEGRLSVERLGPLVLQVAQALQYAHGHGVVHRDLKPANIMVGPQGEAKLTDFGLAFARDFGQITQEGSVVGTPSYMSPEQTRGKRTDARTDLFSLGVVIYEALTGANPFAADTFADAMSLVLNREPKPLLKLAPEVTPELDGLVRKMLAKDPELRPRTMDDVVRFFSSQPGAAVTPRRSRLLMPAAAIMLLGAVVTVALIMSWARRRPVVTGAPQALAVPESSARMSAATPDTVSSRKQPGSVPAIESRQSPIANPANAGPCRVKLTVLPWAQVLIDNHSVGMTPLPERLVLARGPHTIELKHPSFPAFTRNVALDDSVCALSFDLNHEFAFADIRVAPWAAIAVDGQPVDTTPLDRPIAMTLGEHVITLSHPDLGTRVERIRTDSARVYRFDFSMVRK